MGWLENLRKQCLEIKKQIDILTNDLEQSKDDVSGNRVHELEKTLKNYFLHITTTLYEIQGWQSFSIHRYKDALESFILGLKNVSDIVQQKIKKQKEFSLQVGLAKCYSIVRGYTSSITKEAYQNIDAINSQNHKIAGKFFALRGFLIYHLLSLNFDTGFKLGKEVVSVAQKHQHPLIVVESCVLSALPLFYMASWEQMQTHIDNAIVICKQNKKEVNEYIFVEHPVLLLKAMESLSLAYRGFPDKAFNKMQVSCNFIKEMGSPYNLVLAHIFMARICQLQCNIIETAKYAAQAIKLAKEHQILFWQNVGEIFFGWALVQDKNSNDALALQENALLNLAKEKVALYQPLFLSLLAESYQKMGFYEEALGAIIESEKHLNEHYQVAYKIEILNTKGQILLNHENGREEAIICFYDARKIASTYKMRFLEVRPLMSLAKYTDGEEKLYLKNQLNELCSWFQEGFETTSIKEAKLLCS